MVKHQGGQVSAVDCLALGGVVQMAPTSQLDRLHRRNAQAGRADQHQARRTGRKPGRNKTADHCAKRKTHKIAGAVTQQRVESLLDGFRQRISIAALRRHR